MHEKLGRCAGCGVERSLALARLGMLRRDVSNAHVMQRNDARVTPATNCHASTAGMAVLARA